MPLPEFIPASPVAGYTRYIGPIVLGMNDALVEMTGALAGFTMALGNNKLIALAGLTTGVAATLSMAAAEFLAKEAASARQPWKAACYTGTSYLVTVALLLLPFFLLTEPLKALTICLLTATIIIFFLTMLVSRIRQTCFWIYFLKMLAISFSVAAISFLISWCARIWWGIEI